ncbi:MAG: bifunctional folylpolyglutamate synthase/dihydrofolate synthase [Bacteroidota bacterium]|jgi:dihydrofolate synthase/folylpolyglutamate synthase
MTYQQTIDFLFTRLPMFSRIGEAAYKKDLTNTLALCSICNDPHKKFKNIHIAGTNGKGSVSHMLAAILQTAGYKTGLYTSPHLHDFRERIRINGVPVDEQYVIDFTQKMNPHIQEIEPSFFELTVAMAFSYFADQQVDIAIIETGLGGRLDSTNVISPELSIITNIGWDHMNLLGNTRALIAGEKAGIIKTKTPVIIGESLPETREVFEKKSAEMEAPLFFAEEEFSILDYQISDQTTLKIVHEKGKQMNFTLGLSGIYQLKNMLPVLSAIYHLNEIGWNVQETHIAEALAKVQLLTGLSGRWQKWEKDPRVVLDVAHNEDGIRQVTEQLKISSFENLHIVIGMVKDKDIENVLGLLPKHAQYYFTQASIPRALPAKELMQKASIHQLKGTEFTDAGTAIDKALETANQNDMILICGSVFLVGEAIEHLKKIS